MYVTVARVGEASIDELSLFNSFLEVVLADSIGYHVLINYSKIYMIVLQ